MNQHTIELRKAVAGDRRTAAETLSRAFSDDPVFQWMVPDQARLEATLPALFSLFVDAFSRHEETYVAGDATGVALWSPPGVAPIAEEDAEAFGGRLGELMADDAERAEEITTLLDANHPETACWYLQFIAVDPAQHGKGIGSALLRSVLDRLDRDAQPAYLEATSPLNRALYERHGFVVTKELSLTDGPSLFAMWREPLS